MDKFFSFMLYVLWILSIAGLLAVTLNSFQYVDLNFLVVILFLFSLVNTFFAMKKR